MATQAHEYVEKQGYAPPDANSSRASLSYILLLLIHSAPSNTLPKGIRAVVTLLDHKEVMRNSDRITVAIMHSLDPMINSVNQVAILTQEAVGETRRAVDCLYRTGEEIQDKLQHGLEAMREDIQQTAEYVKEGANMLVQAAAMAIKITHKEPRNTQTLGAGGTHTLTYAEVINNCLPAAHLSMMA